MPKTVSATPSDLLTTDQVIERLLLDANLRRVAATCVLPAVKLGDGWRFRRADLEEWIRRQASTNAQGPGGPLMAASKPADRRPS